MVPENEQRLLQDDEMDAHDGLPVVPNTTTGCCNLILPAGFMAFLRPLLRYAAGRHSLYRVLSTLVLLILIAAGYVTMTLDWTEREGQIRPDTGGPSTKAAASRCGRTPSEALLHGCRFDILSFSWLPPACHDEGLTREFLGRANWTWFRTPYPRPGTRDAVATSLVAEGAQGDLFASKDLRAARCEFLWRKLQRFVDGTGAAAVDDSLSSQQLLLDCTRNAVAPNRDSVLDESLDIVFVEYPICTLRW